MTDAPDMEQAALEAQFREHFKDGRLATYPLWDYWVGVDGKTGDLGYEWSDKPHRLVFDLLHHAVALEKALAARSAPEAGKAAVKPLVWDAIREVVNEPWAKSTVRQSIGRHNLGPYAGSYSVQEMTRDGDWGWWTTLEASREPQGICKTEAEAKAAAQKNFEARILSALASSPAPTGAEPVACPSCGGDGINPEGLVRPDGSLADCEICNGRGTVQTPQPVAPTGEIAGLRRMSDAHREHAQSAVEHNATLNRLLSIAEARADRLEAEAADLRRKLEEHQDAEDKAAREMATVIQGLRNRATAAERKLEEARKALEPFAAAKGHFDGHVRDEDTVAIALRHIRAHHVRAAARALSTQVEERE